MFRCLMLFGAAAGGAFVAFDVLRVVGIDCEMKLLKMSFVGISLSSP